MPAYLRVVLGPCHRDQTFCFIAGTLNKYHIFSRHLIIGPKLKIPNFAPDHSLRNRVSNLTVASFSREIALSGISESIKIAINQPTIYILARHIAIPIDRLIIITLIHRNRLKQQQIYEYTDITARM